MSVARPRAIVTSISLVACLGAAIAACTSYARANGEGCLKDADCLTNYCQAQVCASLPTTLTGSSYEEGGTEDTGTTPAVDASDASTPDEDTGAADTGTGG